MAEQVGAVEYTADVDVSGVLRGGKVINKQIDLASARFEGLDTTVSKTAKGVNAAVVSMSSPLSSFNRNVESAGQSVKVFQRLSTASFKPIQDDVAGLANSFTGKLDPAIQKSIKRSRQMRAGFGGLGRGAGQAGIQIQQLIGQIQAGTPITTAFSQQAADLGIVLGLPLVGAIISVGAAIGGTLIPSLFNAGKEVDELREKLKQLEEETGLTANQTAFLAQEERKEVEAKKERIRQLEEEIAAEERLNEQRRAQRAGVGTTESRFARPTVQLDTNAAIEKSNELIVRNRAEVDKLNQEVGKLEENINRYNEGNQEALQKQQKQRDLLKQLNQEAELMRVKNDQGALAAARLAAAYQLGLTNAEKLPDEVDAAVRTIYKQEQATKRAAEAQREKNQAEREAEQEARKAQNTYDRNIESLRQQIAELEGSEAAFKLWADGLRQSAIAAGMNTTEIDKLIERVRTLRAEQEKAQQTQKAQQRLDQSLQELRNAQLARDLPNNEFEVQMGIQALGEGATDEQKRQMEEAIKQMQQLRFESELMGKSLDETFKDIGVSALGDFSNGLARAIATGDSAKDMVRDLAQTILTQLVSALIRTAILAPVLGSLGLVGGSGGGGSLFSGGAIMSTAGLGLGGGRLYGGNVSAGNLYPVTEDGQPELLTQGNKQYLLPGSNGRVTSNRDMMQPSAAPAPIININNYSGGEVDVKSRQQGSGVNARQIIDVVVSDMQRRGKIHSTMLSTTNTTNKTRG